jgi:hypothetical protein
VRGKLFYFANFEQPIQPSETTFTRTLWTAEAQQGVFRYSATDGSVRTVNLLDIARTNGFPGDVDPFMASQLSTINRSLAGGTLRSTDLLRQELAFVVPQRPRQIYPTGRIDWQAAPGLAVRGILNLWWRDLARNPQFPGLDFVNAGFKSDVLHPVDRRRLDDAAERVQSDQLRRSKQSRRIQPGERARRVWRRAARSVSSPTHDGAADQRRDADAAEQPGLQPDRHRHQSNDLGFNVNINSMTFGQTTSTTQTAVGPRNLQLRFVATW